MLRLLAPKTKSDMVNQWGTDGNRWYDLMSAPIGVYEPSYSNWWKLKANDKIKKNWT